MSMTRDDLAGMRQERDQLIEDYMKASRGRLHLSEARMIAIRDRIDNLTQAMAKFRLSNATDA